MDLGPLMLDLAGLSLTNEDKELLANPAVGGVILFARNYESPEQVQALISEMRDVRADIIVAVDQEGGRVQRFKAGMTRLPALRHLGDLYASEPQQALDRAQELGWLMASEMLSLGVDISFAPVLDIDYGRSDVIGDRAFASTAETITALARAYIDGMRQAGMAATGKHFPGHGWVAADSHVALPVDDRPLEQLLETDMVPFAALAGHMQGIMPAHVIYSAVDELPAGFSPYWIQQQLREALGFNGVVFSDDLTMEGATVAGGFAERAEAALNAGCDMVLVCNHREGALEVLQWLEMKSPATNSERLSQLRAKPRFTWQQLQSEAEWQRLHQQHV